jgi:hypothetical protein
MDASDPLLLLLSIGITGLLLVGLLMLRIAELLQARTQCSDELVTDLAVAVPAGTFVVLVLGGFIWVSG